MTLTTRTPTTGNPTPSAPTSPSTSELLEALDPSAPGVDAGIYRLIDAVLELDGWTLSLDGRGDRFEVALVHRDEPGYVIPHFACGQTPGAAALAAVRRFHSIPEIERWATAWRLAG